MNLKRKELRKMNKRLQENKCIKKKKIDGNTVLYLKIKLQNNEKKILFGMSKNGRFN